jgi:hypothetical protein
MKKLFYTTFTFSIMAIVLMFPRSVIASEGPTAAILHVPATVAQQQQFYVDVVIDPQGKSFNAIQGTIVFSNDNLSLVRTETGSSNVTFFVDPPTLKGNTITFSGIIPGGFSGLINPFDPTHPGPAEIVRLVFMGKAAGEAQIIATGMTIADNDGQGTLETVPDQRSFLSILTTVAPSVYAVHDTTPPLLTASVVQDHDLNNDSYTLVFNATDKQSGIDHVEVKEGSKEWRTVKSPYLLQDQSRKSIISIRAIDNAGNATLVSIDAAPHPSDTAVPIVLIIVSLCIVLYVIKQKYIHHRAE